METKSRQLGVCKWEIDTPALLVDIPAVERNIVKMADFARKRGIGLRPYIKTHKSTILAKKQLAAGAIGIGCAKLGEAEVMAEAGIRDILLGNQIIGSEKIARLMNLAGQADVIVAVDDRQNVYELSAAAETAGVRVRILVEVDIGLHRCGVRAGEDAVSLAKYADKAQGLKFCGFMGYEGHLQKLAEPDERAARVKEEVGLLTQTAEMARTAGLKVEIVSAGGTVTYEETGKLPGITEIQPGTYIFMDSNYYPRLPGFERALTVLATVISHPEDNYVVIDAGSKSLSLESGLPEIKDLPGAEFVGFWEEHGKMEVAELSAKLRIGDKIEVFPSHVCTTVNLHDRYFAIKNDRVEAVWEIDARGKLT